jgi:hypothetical protein
MNALAPIETVWRGGGKTSPDPVRVVGKTSKSSTSGHEDGRDPRESSRQRSPLRVEPVFQAETKSRDPFWHGPRLTPTFVTQMLAQAMTPERARLLRTPYGKTDANGMTARLLDRTL